MLMAAIRRRDRGEARRLINQVLVHIYSAGQERSDLLKGLLLELVVMMARAAIDAGGGPSEVLGMNYRFLSSLAEVEDDEDLAAWLRESMDRIFSVIEAQEHYTPPLLVTKALDFMRRNLARDLARDEVARHAGISPSHFSRLIPRRSCGSAGWILPVICCGRRIPRSPRSPRPAGSATRATSPACSRRSRG